LTCLAALATLETLLVAKRDGAFSPGNGSR
jgi:hypothetical protein